MTTPIRPSVTYSGLYEHPIVGKDGRITQVWYDALIGLNARSNTSGDLSAADLHAGVGIVITIVSGVPPTVTISATGSTGGPLAGTPVFGRGGDRGRMGPPGVSTTPGPAGPAGATGAMGPPGRRGSSDHTRVMLLSSGRSIAYDFVPLALGIEPLTFVSDGAGQPILIPFLYS